MSVVDFFVITKTAGVNQIIKQNRFGEVKINKKFIGGNTQLVL